MKKVTKLPETNYTFDIKESTYINNGKNKKVDTDAFEAFEGDGMSRCPKGSYHWRFAIGLVQWVPIKEGEVMLSQNYYLIPKQ